MRLLIAACLFASTYCVSFFFFPCTGSCFGAFSVETLPRAKFSSRRKRNFLFLRKLFFLHCEGMCYSWFWRFWLSKKKSRKSLSCKIKCLALGDQPLSASKGFGHESLHKIKLDKDPTSQDENLIQDNVEQFLTLVLFSNLKLSGFVQDVIFLRAWCVNFDLKIVLLCVQGLCLDQKFLFPRSLSKPVRKDNISDSG